MIIILKSSNSRLSSSSTLRYQVWKVACLQIRRGNLFILLGVFQLQLFQWLFKASCTFSRSAGPLFKSLVWLTTLFCILASKVPLPYTPLYFHLFFFFKKSVSWQRMNLADSCQAKCEFILASNVNATHPKLSTSAITELLLWHITFLHTSCSQLQMLSLPFYFM